MGNIRVLKRGEMTQDYHPRTQAEAKEHEFKANFSHTVRTYSETRTCCEQASNSTCKLAVGRG